MASVDVLLLTTADRPEHVLPALALLPHQVCTLAPDVSVLLNSGTPDVILIDANTDLLAAKSLCRLLVASGTTAPIMMVIPEGGLVALNADWGIADVVLPTAGPAEVDARFRLAHEKRAMVHARSDSALTLGELIIDDRTYAARLRGRPLELTYKEFELLKYLAQHAGRVFTRTQLLQEVWGYDFFGGTRTVDVHVRRLRAKLGLEYENMIGTVRNVGYKFVQPAHSSDAEIKPSSSRV